jgi:hypothetical protein
VEELLQLYHAVLGKTPLDLKIAYSEKTGGINLICETPGEGDNLVEAGHQPDDLGLAIIRGMAEDIAFEQLDGKNVLTVKMKMD